MVSVAHWPAVDKNGEMPPQRALVVKYVAAQSRLLSKHRLKHFAERARIDLALGCCDVPLNRSGEEDVRHDGVAAREWPRPLLV